MLVIHVWDSYTTTTGRGDRKRLCVGVTFPLEFRDSGWHENQRNVSEQNTSSSLQGLHVHDQSSGDMFQSIVASGNQDWEGGCGWRSGHT